MKATTLQVTLELDNTIFEHGQDVEFRLQIANISDKLVEIKSVSGTKSPFGKLVRCIESYNAKGDYKIVKEALPVDLVEDITLPPGKAWEKRMLIPTKHLKPAEGVFRKYTIKGSIRPASLKIGGKEVGRRLEIHPISFDIVPKGYRHIAGKPFAKLKAAIKDATPPLLPDSKDDYVQRIFLASFLLDKYFYNETTHVLMKSLNKVAPDARRVMMVALKRVTGANVSFVDITAWELWYHNKYGGK